MELKSFFGQVLDKQEGSNCTFMELKLLINV